MTRIERWKKINEQMVELLARKAQAYGDSFTQSEVVLRALFPAGIHPDQYRDLLTMIRMIDKFFRLATRRGGKDPMGESPWNDIQGYATLANEREMAENEARREEKWVADGVITKESK